VPGALALPACTRSFHRGRKRRHACFAVSSHCGQWGLAHVCVYICGAPGMRLCGQGLAPCTNTGWTFGCAKTVGALGNDQRECVAFASALTLQVHQHREYVNTGWAGTLACPAPASARYLSDSAHALACEFWGVQGNCWALQLCTHAAGAPRLCSPVDGYKTATVGRLLVMPVCHVNLISHIMMLPAMLL